MILGFTGTRAGMTLSQRAMLVSLVAELDMTGHLNGACHGADRQAVAIIDELHPCLQARAVSGQPRSSNQDQATWADAYRRRFSDRAMVYAVRDYLARDRIIATLCDRLFATPREAVERVRGSGTWATVRYAVKAGKPVTIIKPDGSYERQ